MKIIFRALYDCFDSLNISSIIGVNVLHMISNWVSLLSIARYYVALGTPSVKHNKFMEYSPFRLCIAATLSVTGLPVPSPVF